VSIKVNHNAKIVRVAKAIAPDLMFRTVAEAFFAEIEQSEEKMVTLDFTGVVSVSRSFAHQYALQKKASKKHFVETHVSPQVARMFEVAKHTRASPKVELPPLSRPQLVRV
jgi:anti-anti-sigma regulatory factor